MVTHRGMIARVSAAVAAATAAGVLAACAQASAAQSHGQAQACRSSQLSVGITNRTEATGQVMVEIVLRNIASTSCTLRGYPQVKFVAASGRSTGRQIMTKPGEYAGMLLGIAPKVVLVRLAPHAHAVGWVAWADNPAGSQTNASCIAPARELVAPPRRPQFIAHRELLQTAVCSKLTVEPVQPAGYAPAG